MRRDRSSRLSRAIQGTAAALLAATLAHCTGGGEDCVPGSEGCSCVMNACFTGLQCLSERCVDAAGSGSTAQSSVDPETTAPTTGSGSTAASTGPAADSTGAAEATGPDPTTATTSTTTGPGSTMTTAEPEVCGDGAVDLPEECDDGNNVDDDQCGNDCMYNAPLIALVDPSTSKLYGSAIGDAFDDPCDGVVAGVIGDEDQYAMLAISGSCKRLNLVLTANNYAIKYEASGELPWRGTQNGATQASPCDPSAVPVGYTIYLDGPWVEGMRIACAPLSLVDGALVFGPASNGPAIGGGDQLAVGAMCPKGSIITGHFGYASDRVRGLGFHCARPVAILE